MATPAQLAEESRRALKVRRIVDISTSLIMQSGMSRREAEHVVSIAKTCILELFPEGEETFEVVYAQRFRRLIDEFALPESRPGAAVLPFFSPSP